MGFFERYPPSILVWMVVAVVLILVAPLWVIAVFVAGSGIEWLCQRLDRYGLK